MPLFKLEKLKVKAFSDSAHSSSVGVFEAMFNPESFKRSYGITYSNTQSVGSTDRNPVYTRSTPTDLKLKLILDGNGIHETGAMQLNGLKTVQQRIDEFLTLTYHMNGDIHEPNFLKVEWGEINFSCRLGGVEINYTQFDREGKALRAELDVEFISDTEVEKRLLEENRSSPDLTHKRLVTQGDTLPLLSKEIYGSSDHYLYVARENRLDDFRNLIPGQELFFPPLEKS